MSKPTQAHCNACGRSTKHDVLHSEQSRWKAEQGAVEGGETYETLRCRGCETVKLRSTSWCSEEEDAVVVYYPPAVARRPPAWLADLWQQLPPEEAAIEDLLDEVYAALQNGLSRLAAMGVRAVLEHVMISKAGDQGTFAKNIAEFERLGHVSAKQRERLEAVLEAGHAAIHRGYAPANDDLSTVVGIAEHIIESIYMHDAKVERLKKQVPVRRRRSGG